MMKVDKNKPIRSRNVINPATADEAEPEIREQKQEEKNIY